VLKVATAIVLVTHPNNFGFQISASCISVHPFKFHMTNDKVNAITSYYPLFDFKKVSLQLYYFNYISHKCGFETIHLIICR